MTLVAFELQGFVRMCGEEGCRNVYRLRGEVGDSGCLQGSRNLPQQNQALEAGSLGRQLAGVNSGSEVE